MSDLAGARPHTALIVFHGALKDFLRPVKSCRPSNGVVRYPVTRRASIKDVAEALGVPHTCVGSILAQGVAVGFGHLVRSGERIALHVLEAPRKVVRPTFLRPEPLRELRFLADANVGKLAQRMRLLGFDTAYDKTLDDGAVAGLAAQEGRVVLSKDRGLLKRAQVVYAHLVRMEDPDAQLVEVLRAFGLRPPFAAFSRCLRCNAPLEPVAKETVLHKLEPLTKKYYHEFKRCPTCDKVYWAGSHHERLRERLARLLATL